MRQSLYFTVVCLLATITISEVSAKSPADMDKDNLSRLALASNHLALNLHKIVAPETSRNTFISPLSISTAFAMLHYGTEGETLQELRKTLGYDMAKLEDNDVHSAFHYLIGTALKSASSNEYVLSSANSILVDKDFELKTEYKEDVEKLYEAVIREVDFRRDTLQVTNDVNSWVQEKTKGKIQSLVESLDPETSLLLLNAVYFKGTWKTQFEPKETKPDMFYNGGLESAAKEVRMMHMKSHFPYTEVFDCKALELPYKGENISMLVLLPLTRDGLSDLENSLTIEKFNTIRRQLYSTKVIVSLPKFKVDYSREMSADLKSLGTKRIFTTDADFSRMTKCKNIAVSMVIHKAVVEVNEEGSEAAAVTGIGMNRMRPGLIMPPPEFNADHPFLFSIIDNRSGMILFLGRVNRL